ncbi:hypothetical protein ERUR111494_01490 [Erysipelothrix urinaevulpis]|uniref:hypothetical protein n=1 Tax=Erysipelothrix urinaevulpis TaxID=2683717 RepID=UPI001356ED25|nr:hypothetical protein [Erysipelothrix urinaevulpis]
MKKIMTSIIILLASLSMVVFINTYTVNDLRTEASHALVEKAIDQGIDRLVAEINAIIPLQQEESVLTLKTKIKEDPAVNSLIDKYSLIIIHDLAREEIDTSINEDVQGVLKEYNKEIVGLTGDLINPAYSEIIIDQVVKRIDFDDAYRQGLETVKEKTGPDKLKMIKAIDFFFANIKDIRLMSGIITMVSMVLIIFINRELKKILQSFGLIAGLAFLLNLGTSLIAKGLLNKIDPGLAAQVNISIINPFTLTLLIVMVISIILKNILKSRSQG